MSSITIVKSPKQFYNLGMNEKAIVPKEEDLLPRQQRFVDLYTSLDKKYFGNATACYIDAYGIDRKNPVAYAGAKAQSCKALKRQNIMAAIQKKLSDEGFNDSQADKELTFLMAQHADFKTKLQAIKEYNLLKGRTSRMGHGGVNIAGDVSITQLFNQAEKAKKRDIIEAPAVVSEAISELPESACRFSDPPNHNI